MYILLVCNDHEDGGPTTLTTCSGDSAAPFSKC